MKTSFLPIRHSRAGGNPVDSTSFCAAEQQGLVRYAGCIFHRIPACAGMTLFLNVVKL
jgi:hypothetical protein